MVAPMPSVSLPMPSTHERLTNVGLMLGRHRRRWPNIKSTLGIYIVIVGYSVFNIEALNYVCINRGDQRGYFQFKIIINALFTSF